MIVGRIFDQARREPERTAAVADDVVWSYGALATAIAAAGDRFRGLTPPDRKVAVLRIDSLIDAWIVGLALRRQGITTISVGRAQAVAEPGRDDVAFIVAGERESDAELADIAGRLAAPLIPVGRFQPAASAVPSPGPAPAATPGGHILLTSGTTGTSKKVLRDPRGEAATLDSHAALYAIDAGAVVHAADFPLWTAGGYRWPQLAWSQGGQVVFEQRGDIGHAYRRHSFSHAFVTPAMLRNLLDLPPEALRRNDAMRLLVTGGALSRSLAEAAAARLTRRVISVLASTEASVLAMTPVDSAEDLVWHRLVAGREAQVVDGHGQPLPAGQTGLLRVRVLDGIAGYLDDPAASRVFFRDGWFLPGDLAQFGADGRLALQGRATDVVNCLGNKLAPGPVEQALQERLGVEAVCIFSALGPDNEDQLHVAIETRRAVDRAELEALAANELKLFSRVRFHLVEAMPRNDMGKIVRSVLKQQLFAGRDLR